MDDEMEKCPLCQGKWTSMPAGCEIQGPDMTDVYKVSCSVCGQYDITEDACINLKSDNRQWILSAATRAATVERRKPVFITSQNIEQIIGEVRIPVDQLEAMESLLLRLPGLIDENSGKLNIINSRDYPLAVVRTPQQVNTLIEMLVEARYASGRSNSAGLWGAYIMENGWQRIRELREAGPASDNAFVAMWFEDSLKPAFEEGIRPALEEDCGYEKVIRIDRLPHTEDIVHKILGEIRRSGLIIADYTGQRAGVYYEAGFASGLGINVIHTCRKDEMEKLHFDIRNRSTVVWEGPQDLREKLKNLIRGLGWDRRKAQTA